MILLTLLTVALDGTALDEATLARTLAALDAAIPNFTGEFEGRLVFDFPERGGDAEDRVPNGVRDEFSGLFARGPDGMMLLDVYHQYASDRRVTRQTLAMKDGQNVELIRRFEGVGGNAKITEGRRNAFQSTASPGIFFLAWFLERSLDEARERDAFTKMVYRGREDLDGRRCDVVEFVYEGMNTVGQRYFIDMAIGGHPVRFEYFLKDGKRNPVSLRVDATYRKFSHEGAEFWFPVSGASTGFSDDRDPKRATHTEAVYFLQDSLTFSDRLPDSLFSVKFNPGTVISDELRQVRTEFGRQEYSRLSRAETEERLREQLAVAEQQRGQVEAASWSRRGPHWSTRIPWVVAALAAATVGLVLYRRRSGA